LIDHKNNRIPKEDWYMEIARVISMRSTCIRAHAGCVVVKNDAVISQGYSEAPRGEPNCCDLGVCERDRLGIEPGKNYELCRSVHAEANAIINTARNGISVIGGKMYIYFERLDGQKKIHGDVCIMCQRLIKNAGIKKYVLKEII
jgi:dCMP deaminase